MSAQPEHSPAAPEMPEKDLRSIRAALVVPQDLEAFDAGLKATLDKVRVTLDIGPYNEFLHTWWLLACSSVKDPESHRQMWDTVAKLEAGEPIPRGRPAREVLEERLRQVRASR